MRKTNVWILLADSARARVLRAPEAPDPVAHHAPMETIFEAKAQHLPLREIMTDVPGRTFSSVGRRRSAMEYHSDPVRDETRAFAQSIVDNLDGRRGEFEQLVVCAPPRMLGALRDVMPEKLAAVVRTEVDKDLTKLPEIELRDVLHRLIVGLD